MFNKEKAQLWVCKASLYWKVLTLTATIYDLVSFSSVVESGGNEIMVRITKVKKSWLTSIHKRTIGEGEELRRLYAHSRKYWKLIESLID